MYIYRSLLIVFVVTVSLSVKAGNVSELIRLKLEEGKATGNWTLLSENIHTKTSIAAFYQSRQFNQVWTNREHARSFIKVILASADHGLLPADYHAETLRVLFKKRGRSDLELMQADLLLTDAFLLYAYHMIYGKVNSETIDPEWQIVKRNGDPIAKLNAFIESGDLMSIVSALSPNQNGYKTLQHQLVLMNKLIEKGDWDKIEGIEGFEKGTVDPKIKMIVNRLIILGDLSGDYSPDGNKYDDKLEAAVQLFQSRHGLEATGKIDAKTLAALNMPLEERMEKIKVNMERWRWLPDDFGGYYLFVNIANYAVNIYKDGKLEKTHKAIVGTTYRKTPVFNATMSYMVLNPTWTVPPTILKNDVIPAIKKAGDT